MKTKLIISILFNFVVGFALGSILSFATGSPVYQTAAITGILFIGAGIIVGKFTGSIAFSLITGTPITFNGEEAREGMIDPAFSKPELNLFHFVVRGIVAKKQVAFLQRMNKITLADAGCGTGVQTKTLTPSQKFWEPNKLKIWLQQCADDLEQTFFTWGLKKGIQRKDLTATTFEDYILAIMPDAISDDLLRLAWFGDTAADINANGGKLLNASDVQHYTQMDGFWKYIFAAVTGGTTQRYTISENALGTFALQDALAANAAYLCFKGLMTGTVADSRLKTRNDKVIVCTTSLFENWLAYKESQSFDRSFERQAQGFQTDVFRGVNIIAFDLWDRWIRSDFQDGTAYYLPHRAVLTVPENLQIGLDTNNVEEMDIFFDKTTELHNFKGGYMADVQIPYDFMISVAY